MRRKINFKLVIRTKTKKVKLLSVLVLFFCLLSNLALAALPTVGRITPLSGSTPPNVPNTFTCTYNDSDGWANLREVYFLISPSSTRLNNAVYLYYHQDSNSLFLRDDANAMWILGGSPGGAATIQNSQVILNCELTTVSGSASTLTVNWNITFKPAYSGKKYNTYLKVIDDNGNSVRWSQRGIWTVNYPPTLGTITPASGTGKINVAQTFTTTYSDSDGWQNLRLVYLLINTSTSDSNCFYAYYDQNANKLYLRNDANTSWLGGAAPGMTAVLQNSYAKLDCASTSVSGSGPTLTVNWSVVLKTPFTGTKNTYLSVKDDVNASVGWTQVGTWTIPNNAPAVGTISPSSGASTPDQTVNFTANYSDPDTWLNIQYSYLLVNTSTDGTDCFYGYYDKSTNKLYLRDDANTAWLGGYPPGDTHVIENSYAKLNCASTSVSGSGATMTVKWSVALKAPFIGTKNIYLYVEDNANTTDGWALKGTWTIQDLYTATTIIDYSYDDLNRLKGITSDGTNTTYTHDEVGNIQNETTQGSAP